MTPRHAAFEDPALLATAFSSATYGVDAYLVEVEVDVARGGIPKFILVGLPDAAVKESAERVAVALRSQGFRFRGLLSSHLVQRRAGEDELRRRRRVGLDHG